MPTESSLILLVFKWAWAPLLVFLAKMGWDSREISKIKKAMELHEEKNTLEVARLKGDLYLLQNQAVSEKQVREIVKEICEPIREDQAAIKKSTKEIADNVVLLRVAFAGKYGHTEIGKG